MKSRSESTLELDWETFGTADLTAVGLDRYTADPAFEVLMGAYSIDRGPVRHWDARAGRPPRELVEALEDPHVVKWAFNAQFERVVARRGRLAKTARRNWRCTKVLAGLAAFNGPLSEVGARLGLAEDQQKDKRGKQLIRLFCQPQPITRKNPHVRRSSFTDPEEWQEFCEYNIQDVIAERAVRDRLSVYFPDDAWGEWDLYELDQEINDLGWPVNVEFCRLASRMAEERKAELTAEMRALTGLNNPGSPAQLLPWLRDGGYTYGDLRKESVEKTLAQHRAAPFLDPTTEKVLRLRQWQARLSVKKYDAIQNSVGPGGRVRFLYQHAGAGRTGRWAGRMVQPQNLARTPGALEDDWNMEFANTAIETGRIAYLKLLVDEPMEALVGCVRSAFQAPSGYQFIVADLASIETAVIAWLTDCRFLLRVFEEKLDPYKEFATHFYGVPYDQVTRKQRKDCKPPVLGCGYRLGGGDLRDGVRTGLWGYAENMGVDMPRAEAHRAVQVYRSRAPEVVEAWSELEQAAERTIRTHETTSCGKVQFEWRSPFLLLRLPTGRPIFYYRPKIEPRRVPTGRYITKRSRGWDLDGAPEGEEVQVEETWIAWGMTYLGKNQKTRQWVRIPTHGGRTIEQMTQATARDVLAAGMKRAAADGFKIVGHSHDEVIALHRKDDNYFTLDRLIGHLTRPIPGMDGLPLGAAGFVSDYYKKD